MGSTVEFVVIVIRKILVFFIALVLVNKLFITVVVFLVYIAAPALTVYSYFFFSFFITLFNVVKLFFTTVLVHVLMFSLLLFLL